MTYTPLKGLKKIIDDLSRDEGLLLAEKLIRFGMVTEYVTEGTKKLEDEMATCKGGLIQCFRYTESPT